MTSKVTIEAVNAMVEVTRYGEEDKQETWIVEDGASVSIQLWGEQYINARELHGHIVKRPQDPPKPE